MHKQKILTGSHTWEPWFCIPSFLLNIFISRINNVNNVMHISTRILVLWFSSLIFFNLFRKRISFIVFQLRPCFYSSHIFLLLLFHIHTIRFQINRKIVYTIIFRFDSSYSWWMFDHLLWMYIIHITY